MVEELRSEVGELPLGEEGLQLVEGTFQATSYGEEESLTHKLQYIHFLNLTTQQLVPGGGNGGLSATP